MNLDRREFLKRGALSGAAVFAAPQLLAATNSDALYSNSIVIDGLGFPGSPASEEGAALGAAELADVRVSGLSACHLTIGAIGSMPPLEAFESIIRDADRWDHEAEAHANIFRRVRSVADIHAAKAAGRTGLIYGLQDGVSFEDDLDRLSSIRRAGVRVIQPTYNRHNRLGDGCMEPTDAGLSRNGVDAIKRICELGITVDLSHCGRQTTADAITAATRPVNFTHTGCYSLAEHPRHRTDAEIRAAADSGGIVGIYVMPYLAKGAQPSAVNVINHIEHAIQVAGEDHVSIGTDGNISPSVVTEEYKEQFRKNVQERKAAGIAAPFETEEGYLFARDLNTPRRFETLADLLLDRGHSEARVEKILGANLVRVFSDTWNA